jgi:hypothetical protein
MLCCANIVSLLYDVLHDRILVSLVIPFLIGNLDLAAAMPTLRLVLVLAALPSTERDNLLKELINDDLLELVY